MQFILAANLLEQAVIYQDLTQSHSKKKRGMSLQKNKQPKKTADETESVQNNTV